MRRHSPDLDTMGTLMLAEYRRLQADAEQEEEKESDDDAADAR